MKKDIIDLVIGYGSSRSLWLAALTNNGTPQRIKRLEQLSSAYFDKILKVTRSMRYKEAKK